MRKKSHQKQVGIILQKGFRILGFLDSCVDWLLLNHYS